MRVPEERHALTPHFSDKKYDHPNLTPPTPLLATPPGPRTRTEIQRLLVPTATLGKAGVHAASTGIEHGAVPADENGDRPDRLVVQREVMETVGVPNHPESDTGKRIRGRF
ncbi:hypothetical protein ACI2LJ_23140 [Streptomyces sp. NPDC088090]|uniref:hypothetical protein n=1 Tax=Streptomyces sp. NPDC088090 TaxID=3365822 RepID=UPI00384AC487